MKIQFIAINKYKSILLIIYSILLFLTTIVLLELNYTNTELEQEKIKTETPKQNETIKQETKEKTQTINSRIKPNENKQKEYENMPSNIDGYKVVGKLEIPKIKLTTYILGETTKDSLNKSVTKLTGPSINKEGNFCITGHNYNNGKMFGKLNKLIKGDIIILTDTYNRSVEYTVSTIDKVLPTAVEVLSQNTLGEREVTLITCTKGALKRIVVKAIEEYD